MEIGADRAFGPGERLPERVDAVMETVGAATWSHSVNSLRARRHHRHLRRHVGRRPGQGRADQDLLPAAAGGRLDHGHAAPSWSGWRGSSSHRGIRPVVDCEMPLAQAREGFARMVDGDVFGKVVFTV